VHVLIRDALYDELPATRRLRLHRDVGEALERLYAHDPEPHLTELAHHFRRAVPVADAARAVGYATRAGDRAALLLAYEEAARLYVTALELVDAQPEACELLLRLGDVQARQGDIAASKETFVRAADAARAAGRPEHLARAALGYGGRFVWARAWGDERLVPLLEEALAALPEDDGALRARLLARLAGGPLRDTHPAEARERMAQKAVDMARRLGDPGTLAYTLEGRYDANWGPDPLEGRRAIADELLALAAASGDAERAYAGHDCRFIATLEAGDLAEARQSHEAATLLADQLRQPSQLWDSAARRAQLALFDGRLEEAEASAGEALTLGLPVQSVNAQLAFDLQMYALRREQGRLAEVVDVVERAVDQYPAYPVWRYVLVDVLTELGRHAEARAMLARVDVEDYPVYVEMQWLFSLSLLADVSRALAEPDVAESVYALLLPYAHRNAVLPPELCFGSVSRALGNLAATTGRRDEAVRHLEVALAMNNAGGSGTWVAHTQYDLGRTLLERNGRGDRLHGEGLLAAAAASAGALGLRALAAKVEALRGL
jgi:tetratricopeptide (TPR) repeat protein